MTNNKPPQKSVLQMTSQISKRSGNLTKLCKNTLFLDQNFILLFLFFNYRRASYLTVALVV